MRLRSGDKHHPRKSADRKAQISPVSETTAFLICALRSADFLGRCLSPERNLTHNSGRLTSGSRPGQAVPSPFCQRSKDEGKLRPKFTKCEKINIFEHAAGFRPPVAMAKPKWRQILLSLTAFSNVASKEGKPMSCACSVFIPVKRMGVCNFSPTVRSDVEERFAEERLAWNDKNVPAWPKNISVL